MAVNPMDRVRTRIEQIALELHLLLDELTPAGDRRVRRIRYDLETVEQAIGFKTSPDCMHRLMTLYAEAVEVAERVKPRPKRTVAHPEPAPPSQLRRAHYANLP